MDSMNRYKKWKQSERQNSHQRAKAAQFLSGCDVSGDSASVKRKTLLDYSLVNNVETPSQFKQLTIQAKGQDETLSVHCSDFSNSTRSSQLMHAKRDVIFAPNISLPTQRDVVTTPSQHSIAPGSLASYYNMDIFADKQRAHLSAVLSNPVTPLWREYYSEASLVPQAQTHMVALSLAGSSDGKETTGTERVGPAKRSFFVYGATFLLIAFLLFGTVVVLFPIEPTITPMSVTFFQPVIRMISPAKNAPSTRVLAAMTATAVTQDGYDAGGSATFADVPQAASNQQRSVVEENGLNRFFYGQCTYWANMRYHQLTGHWVPWVGSAYQWAYQAPVAGWRIGDRPNPHGPSILVLAPNAQGAGAYGHVAVVEKVNRDGTVLVSSWNWKGAWGKKSWETFHVGQGVSFIWYD